MGVEPYIDRLRTALWRWTMDVLHSSWPLLFRHFSFHHTPPQSGKRLCVICRLLWHW